MFGKGGIEFPGNMSSLQDFVHLVNVFVIIISTLRV